MNTQIRQLKRFRARLRRDDGTDYHETLTNLGALGGVPLYSPTDGRPRRCETGLELHRIENMCHVAGAARD